MRRILGAVMALAIILGAAPAGAVDNWEITRQRADVFRFADAPDVVDTGDAFLRRTDTGIATSIRIDGAEPGSILTTWWVVWNTPEGCLVPFACNEEDLFNPDAGLAIGYAGGGRTDASGTYLTRGMLAEGQALLGFPYPEFIAIGVELPESTLIDSDHAEVHLVVRNHGQPVTGLVNEMLTTFNAGCAYVDPFAESAPAYGRPGPNTCVDTYFAVFPSAG